MNHVAIGGGWDTGTSTLDSRYTVCNCACPTCMSGRCCLTTAGGGSRWPDTGTTLPEAIAPVLRLWPTDADGQPLVGYWRCTCQTIVPPGVEHRCPA